MGDRPLRGPAFGTYDARDVAWLLTDLSDAALERPTEDREHAIQSGREHYAESLPIEFAPDEAYTRLYRELLAASAPRVAAAVGAVTEWLLERRGTDIVLVSLARAGTPVGVLVRRWALTLGLELPHYAISVVRDRGVDPVALEYLARHHDPARVVFLDGWTGKGAITRELFGSLAGQDRAFVAELAVLADPGGCATVFGTRDDLLVPSACLNSTVSGLVSRTVVSPDLLGPGDFHGAKFYAELASDDVSSDLIDAVVAHFDPVAAEDALTALRRGGHDLTWAGRRVAAQVAARYRISDLNLVKPGVGETTRVLLRRVPWRVLVRGLDEPDVAHILALARQRGVRIEVAPDLGFAAVGLIHPSFGVTS